MPKIIAIEDKLISVNTVIEEFMPVTTEDGVRLYTLRHRWRMWRDYVEIIHAYVEADASYIMDNLRYLEHVFETYALEELEDGSAGDDIEADAPADAEATEVLKLYSSQLDKPQACISDARSKFFPSARRTAPPFIPISNA